MSRLSTCEVLFLFLFNSICTLVPKPIRFKYCVSPRFSVRKEFRSGQTRCASRTRARVGDVLRHRRAFQSRGQARAMSFDTGPLTCDACRLGFVHEACLLAQPRKLEGHVDWCH